MNKEQKKKFKMLSFILIPVIVFGWSIWYSNGVKQDKANQIPEILAVKSDDYKKGDLNGKVVLIEYLDFECEACGAFYPLIKQLEKDIPNELLIVTRYFPLPGHKNSMVAAKVAEASAKQGKYFEMHDTLFENQKDWGEKGIPDLKMFLSYVEKMGLDMNKFNNDYNSAETQARINRDVKEGNILGNTGTPSFYLQGKKLEGIKSYEGLKTRIQYEIDKMKGEK